jgi:hypothetical protein
MINSSGGVMFTLVANANANFEHAWLQHQHGYSWRLVRLL